MYQESRDSAFCQRQKRYDPFLEAWIDQIPKTNSSRAVWECNRYKEGEYTPFAWGQLELNPELPSFLVGEVFRNISDLRLRAPRSPANSKMWPCFWFLYLPFDAMITVAFVYVMV